VALRLGVESDIKGDAMSSGAAPRSKKPQPATSRFTLLAALVTLFALRRAFFRFASMWNTLPSFRVARLRHRM